MVRSAQKAPLQQGLFLCQTAAQMDNRWQQFAIIHKAGLSTTLY